MLVLPLPFAEERVAVPLLDTSVDARIYSSVVLLNLQVSRERRSSARRLSMDFQRIRLSLFETRGSASLVDPY